MSMTYVLIEFSPHDMETHTLVAEDVMETFSSVRMVRKSCDDGVTVVVVRLCTPLSELLNISTFFGECGYTVQSVTPDKLVSGDRGMSRGEIVYKLSTLYTGESEFLLRDGETDGFVYENNLFSTEGDTDIIDMYNRSQARFNQLFS